MAVFAILRGRVSRWSRLGVLALGFLAGCAVPGPPVPAQDVPAQSYIVVDFHSHKILAAYEPAERRQVASLTKIATAIVVLDWIERSGADPGAMALVPPSAGLIGGANPLGLRPGDQIALRDALYGALMASDNVCAETLAHFVGMDLLRRRGRPGNPVGVFVEQMNMLAKKHGLTDTRFVNPHGMDNVDPLPFSTAEDVARLSIVAMGKASFIFYVRQSEREVFYLRGGQKLGFKVKNTNKMVLEPEVDGIKTGLTNRAGPCVAVSAKRPNLVTTLPDGRKQITPQRLIVVVLGANDRFGMAQSLLARGWRDLDAWNAAGRTVGSPEEILTVY